MAWTQTEYDTLKAAIASGVLSVKYADRTVTYHSLKDMRELLAVMERELNPATTKTHRYITTSKGV
jgi:hypothetical protein